MKVAVWDTYVKKENGTVMHFDIIVPAELKDEGTIYNYGKEYLHSKGVSDKALAANECQFCHVEVVKPQWEEAIKQKGYYIYEMENCKG